MMIHFVCMGNTFRSRMAEAYFNSLGIIDWRATSSGIEAFKNSNGDITPYAKYELETRGILGNTPAKWNQTEKEVLEKADRVIFMHPSVYNLCEKQLNPSMKNYEIWDIKDYETEPLAEQYAHMTFEKIKQKIDTMDILQK